MSMWPEPELEDTVLPDGRRWQHVRTCSSRIDVAKEMAMEIESCGTFLQHDAHETEGYFVLRGADGKAVCVAKLCQGWEPEVQGHYGRPATPEEMRLAGEVSEKYGIEILRQAGFEVPGENPSNGGLGL